MMNKKTWPLALLAFILIGTGSLKAQALQGFIADSLRSDDSLAVDTLYTAPDSPDTPKKAEQPVVENDPFFITARGRLQKDSIASDQTVYRFKNLIHQNYTGFADVFRRNPAIQVFDFMDMGQPRYVASFNLLPHQSGLIMDGILLNDPVTGMFNTRNIPLDMISAIEDGSAAFAMNARAVLNDAVHLHSRNLQPVEPYTRIMYREGDFGYTDLDISFARKFSDRLTVELGGINKYYNLSRYHGFNYRSGVRYALTPNLYTRGRLHMNREQVWLRNQSHFPLHKYREDRDAFYNDWIYLTADDTSAYWHGQLALTRDRKTFRSDVDSFRVDQYHQNYQAGLMRRMHFNDTSLLLALNLYQYRFWGTPYRNLRIDSGARSRIQWQLPLARNLSLQPSLNMHYRYGEDPLWSGAMLLDWRQSFLKTAMSARFDQRYPLPAETIFHYQEIAGNEDIRDESMWQMQARATLNIEQSFGVSGRLIYGSLHNEIRFRDNRFVNGADRDWLLAIGDVHYEISKFRFSAGGHISAAQTRLSPRRSSWLRLQYHDRWLDGAIIIDAVGNFRWIGGHHRLYYQPMLERFYYDAGISEGGYYTFSYKLAATVKQAELFMEMDNPFSYDYQYIYGYPEYYRRVRLGVNWVLWD